MTTHCGRRGEIETALERRTRLDQSFLYSYASIPAAIVYIVCNEFG